MRRAKIGILAREKDDTIFDAKHILLVQSIQAFERLRKRIDNHLNMESLQRCGVSCL